MRPGYFALLAALSLTGCIDATTFTSHNVEVRSHRTLPASGVTQLNIANVSGSIAVTTWDRPTVDVRALVYGADQSAIDRTHVATNQSGSEITVKTEYDPGGNEPNRRVRMAGAPPPTGGVQEATKRNLVSALARSWPSSHPTPRGGNRKPSATASREERGR